MLSCVCTATGKKTRKIGLLYMLCKPWLGVQVKETD